MCKLTFWLVWLLFLLAVIFLVMFVYHVLFYVIDSLFKELCKSWEIIVDSSNWPHVRTYHLGNFLCFCSSYFYLTSNNVRSIIQSNGQDYLLDCLLLPSGDSTFLSLFLLISVILFDLSQVNHVVGNCQLGIYLSVPDCHL